MKKILILIISNISYAQISINSNPFTYTQDFGTTDITSWINNSTYLGWYATNNAPGTLHQNITAVPPTNTGSFYTYECSGNNDEKIGSRASGTSGTIYYGMRFINTSGISLTTFTLSFDWFQLSLAENANNANNIDVEYKAINVFDSISSSGFSPFIRFTCPNNSSISGVSQISGYPCTVSGSKSITICVNIPVGNEIIIRWKDINDPANDHHTAIDNVSITFNNNLCSSLPIELLSFKGTNYGTYNKIDWITHSEINNDYFTLESSNNEDFLEIVRIDGSGNSSSMEKYEFIDYNPKRYYRLKQTDYNGDYTYSNIIAIENNCNNEKPIKITNLFGQEVTEESTGLKLYFYKNHIDKKFKLNY